MRAALLSKAALCICPPAMLATTAAYVPPVRSAVHHATRPHAKPVNRATVRPRTVAAARAGPCAPAIAAPPIVPLATFAEPVPSDGGSPGTSFLAGSPLPGIGVSGLGGGTGTGGGGVVTTPPVTAVPEPTTWSMMLMGFGVLGGILRSRQRSKPGDMRQSTRQSRIAGGSLALGTLQPVQAMTTAASVGSKTTLLAKAVMCVCPPAMMVATVAGVPAVRKTVYAATMPREAVPVLTPQTVAPPCDPSLASLAAS